MTEEKKRYLRVLRYLIETIPPNEDGEIEYNSTILMNASRETKANIQNIPDFKYHFTRRCFFPEDIIELGYNTIVKNARSNFSITWDNQLEITLPDIEIEDFDSNAIPDAIKDFLIEDEQTLISIINYCGILDRFTQNECSHILSHYRTTYYSMQVEMDAFYVSNTMRIFGVNFRDNTKVLFPLEAKIRRKEKHLIRNQLTTLIELVATKYPNHPIVCISAILLENKTILLMAFRKNQLNELEMCSAKRYRLIPNVF